MNTIRSYIWTAAGVSAVVWVLWLVLGGIFSAASSVLPHAWVIVLVAVVVGIVAWVLRYPAAEINALGENKVVWGVFQTVLVVGFLVLFIQAVLWVNDSKLLLWIGIDASPRVHAFMSVIVVALCLFPLPPLINWVVPTSGIFAAAVWRTLFATSFLLLVASLFLPKTLFNSTTSAPLATMDSEGNTFYDPWKKFSPATGEELKPITPEQAKKIKPWWGNWWSSFEKWNADRLAAAEDARKKAEEARLAAIPPDTTRIRNPLRYQIDALSVPLNTGRFRALRVELDPPPGEVITTAFMMMPRCVSIEANVLGTRSDNLVLRVKNGTIGENVYYARRNARYLPLVLGIGSFLQLEASSTASVEIRCI